MADAGGTIDLRREEQRAAVADEVSALIAVVRPILLGLLNSLKGEVVREAGGLQNIKLFMLARLRVEGDGDCGVCYEYAVHDAIRRKDNQVYGKVHDALSRHCGVPGTSLESILFGAEKSGTKQLIDTASGILTDQSRLLTGRRSQPPKLKSYLSTLAAAFRKESTRKSLPTSINGLWKADLFLGHTDSDKWVGTTVKVNARKLEAANGLRVGIVPAYQGGSDAIINDDAKNLVVCPLPYDGSFMETFYNAWGIVQQFMTAKAQVPGEVHLPIPAHRHVAKELERRREFPVVDVIEALGALAQPHLLATVESATNVVISSPGKDWSATNTLIAPISTLNDD